MSFDFRVVNGDLGIGQDGDLDKVEDTEKLIQDMLKIIVTPIGSNKFYPWYGSPITQSLVGMALDFEMMSTISSGQLQNSLESLQRLQQEQSKHQRVTPFELLAAIKRVSIERNRTDPRFFLVIVEGLTRALTEANTQLTIKPTL